MSLQGAFKHGYTDYSDAYYSIVESSDLRNKQRIVIGIWADKASYDADKADNGIAQKPLDVIIYESVGDEYTDNFAVLEQEKEGKNVRKSAYEVIKGQTDIEGIDFTSLTDK